MFRRSKPKEEKPKPVVEWKYSGNVVETESGEIEFLTRGDYVTASKSGGAYYEKPALKVAGRYTFGTYAEFEAGIKGIINGLEQTIEEELHLGDVAEKLKADPDKYRVEKAY